MYRRDVLGAAGGILGGPLVPLSTGGAASQPTPPPPAPADGGETRAGAGAASFAPLGSLAVAGAREAVVGPDGSTAYVAAWDGFAVVDVSEPARPRLVAERRGLLPDAAGGPLSQVQEVAVDGDRLLVVGPAHPDDTAVKAALLYDVSDPTDPDRLAVHRTDYPIHNAALRGGRAYLTANGEADNVLEIVAMGGAAAGEDGAGSSAPSVLGRWTLGDADDAWDGVHPAVVPLHDVIVRGDVAYCSYWDAGTWLLDVGDPAAPAAIGRVGGRPPAELAAVDSPGVAATELPGNHHSAAIDGSGTLLAIGREAWDADGDGVGGPGGIDLVDVSDPEAPERLATVRPPPTPEPGFGGVWTTAHNFRLREGFLYSAWYQGGVRVHDVSEPSEPREVAAWRDAETTRFWTAVPAGSALVAPSMGTETSGPGLYTFPLPDGAAGATPTRTATEAPPPAAGRSATPTRRAPPTTTAGDPTETSPGAVTAVPSPEGLGVAATAVVGGLAWLLARWRRG